MAQRTEVFCPPLSPATSSAVAAATGASAPQPASEPDGRLLGAAVIVSALGYFVDIYDLVLFSIVRVSSLTELGVSGSALVDQGARLLSLQMWGMLVGGIFWGVVGDRVGRLHILFGSIVTYSLATLANAYVQSIEVYGLLRFVAGVGLAGELGAGVTLVAESLPARRRGLGTMLVASVGVSGAVLASFVASRVGWRTAYQLGGGLGLLLLLLRIRVSESALFQRAKQSPAARGSLRLLLASRARLVRYLRSVLIGAPTWFIVGVLITFAPEVARAMGVTGQVTAGAAVMACYLGLVVGDVLSGLVSQLLGSRRKTVLIFLAATSGAMALYFVVPRGASPAVFYGACLGLGVAAGYWAVFVTMAAEQFGTNLRATVATTVPNFVRGLVPLMLQGFLVTRDALGLLQGAVAIGAVCITLAGLALVGLPETFGRDLDWVEE